MTVWNGSWEKGTNENGNRLLRRFFPKGTNFEKVTQRQIQEAVDWLNHYPRKILGWKCAADFSAPGAPRPGSGGAGPPRGVLTTPRPPAPPNRRVGGWGG